jgi:hypothetical protein
VKGVVQIGAPPRRAVWVNNGNVIEDPAGHVPEHADRDLIGVRHLWDVASDILRQRVVQVNPALVDELEQDGPGEGLRNAGDAHILVRSHRAFCRDVGQPEALVPDVPVRELHGDGDTGRARALGQPILDDGYQGGVRTLLRGA